mgnify:CR=1 FL=1|jgi:hypothetical protein
MTKTLFGNSLAELMYQSKVWEMEERIRTKKAPKTLEKDGGCIRTILKNLSGESLLDAEQVRKFIRKEWKNRSGSPRSRRGSDQDRAFLAWASFVTFIAAQLPSEKSEFDFTQNELTLLQFRIKLQQETPGGVETENIRRILQRMVQEFGGIGV